MHKKRGEQVSESLVPQRFRKKRTCVSEYTRLAFKLPHENNKRRSEASPLAYAVLYPFALSINGFRKTVLHMDYRQNDTQKTRPYCTYKAKKTRQSAHV